MKLILLCVAALAFTTFAQNNDDGGEEIIELGGEIEIVEDGEDIDNISEITEPADVSSSEEPIIELDGEIEVVEDDGAIDKMPEITEFVDAPYPDELIEEGIAGAVLLEIIVSETGVVDSAAIVRSLHPALDTLALNAISRFKFSPAEVGGEPVAVMLQYEYSFHPPAPITAQTVSTDDVNADDDDGDAIDMSDPFEMTVYGREEVKEVAHHRITLAEVKRIPGMGNDAIKVVQAMPGVARPAFGMADVAVRGAPGWASGYHLDGVPMIGLYHMGGLNSIYPADALDGLDFYPGGFSTRYGAATGGIIEMRSRRPKNDRLQGHVDLSMLNGALFLEGPVNDKVSFMASARRNFAGDLLKLYFKHADPGNLGISIAPFFWDYLLRTDVAINENHHMYISMLGSRDSLGVFIPSADMGSTEIEGDPDGMSMMMMFHTLTVGLDSRLSDQWSNSLRVAGTYAHSRMSLFGVATYEEQPWIWYLRNQVSYKANDKVTVHTGADIELIDVNIKLAMNTGLNMIYRDTMSNWIFGNVGGYVNVEWKPVEKLLLIPGVRIDHYNELVAEQSNVPAFRVSSKYGLTDAHTLKAAFGTYNKSPEPYGFVLHEVAGQPDLPAIKAEHYVVGHEWRITDLISLDAQTYYNRMWDIARAYDPRIDYDPNLSADMQKRYFPDGRGRMYGLELMLRHNRSDKFFGWISYTLSRSESWSKIDDKYILSRRDEPHHLQLLGSWQLPKNWDFGVRTRFVSGKPASPVIGTIEDENYKYIRPVYGELNSIRQDPFFQVDLRADKKIPYERWALTYYLDLQNVLWPLYKSPEFTRWNYNYTEQQKIAMIPMISAGVRAEF